MTKEVLKRFFPQALLEYTQLGEFRDVVSVFISFKDPDTFEDLNDLCEKVIISSDKYGGYFNSLDFGDKGGTMLVVFGMPKSFENNITRAVNFVYEVREVFKEKLRAGIVAGIVFAGIVGIDKRCTYTSLGDTINQSARFMMKAEWGEAWLSNRVSNKANKLFFTESLGEMMFKGKEKPIKVFKLSRRKKKVEQKLFEGDFIGRKENISDLVNSCKPILDGRFGGVVYLYGDAGIGKSRLMYELTQDFGDKVKTFVLKSDNILQQSFNPFISFFEDYFEQTGLDTIEEKREMFESRFNKFIKECQTIPDDAKKNDMPAQLKHTRTVIASLLGLEYEDSIFDKLDSKDIPEVIYFAIKDFFKINAMIKPLIIQLEDIQWLDTDSTNVMQVLTRNINEFPIVIFALGRFYDDSTPPILDLDENIQVTEYIIGKLSTNDSTNLIKNMLSGEVQKDLLSQVISKSQGNPFYIEQLCSYLIENDFLELINGKYRLKENIRKNFEIPTEINSILISRIDRLSNELRETIQMASIIGKEFDTRILYEMLEIVLEMLNLIETGKINDDFKQLSSYIQVDMIKNILFEGEMEKLWSNLSELKYMFKHALLVDAVYEMQLKRRLTNLHRIAGDAINRIFKDEDGHYAEIAHHYELGEIYDKARDFYEKAGHYSKNLFQNKQAISHFKKAIQIDTELIGKTDKKTIELYIHLGETYNNACEYEEALKIYNKAFDLLTGLEGENDSLLGFVYNKIGEIYANFADDDKANEYYQKALDSYKDCIEGNKVDVAEIYNNIGVSCWDRSRFDEAIENYRIALEMRKSVLGEMHRLIGLAYNDIAMVLWEKGEFQQALSNLDKALNIMLTCLGEEHIRTAFVYHNIALVLFRTGEYEKSISYCNKSTTIYKNILGEKHILIAEVYNTLGTLYWGQSKYKDAIESTGKALIIYLETLGERHPDTATLFNNIGLYYDSMGDYDKALEYLEKALNIRLDVFGEGHSYNAFSYSNIGKVYYNLSDYDEALKNLNVSLDIRNKVGDMGNIGYDYIYLALSHIRKKEYDKALDYAKQHLENINTIGVDVEKGKTYLSIALVLSEKNDVSNDVIDEINELIKSEKKLETPADFFELAVNTSKEAKFYHTLVPAMYEYGNYLFAENKEKGEELLNEAKNIATEHNMNGELVKIDRIRKKLGKS